MPLVDSRDTVVRWTHLVGGGVPQVINVLGEIHEKNIMKIIVDTTNVKPDDETIEVDLETLGDGTLRELQSYVRRTLQNKSNMQRINDWELGFS